MLETELTPAQLATLGVPTYAANKGEWNWGKPGGMLGSCYFWYGEKNPPALSGTVSTVGPSTTITGVGTAFLTDLKQWGPINIDGLNEVVIVTNINSDTEFVADKAVDVSPATPYRRCQCFHLGMTQSGKLNMEQTKTDISLVQLGSDASNRVLTGQSVKIEIPLSEFTPERAAMLGLIDITRDAQGIPNGGRLLKKIGQDDRSIAAPLYIVKEIGGKPSTNPIHWMSAPICVPTIKGDMGMGNDLSTATIEFMVYEYRDLTDGELVQIKYGQLVA